MKQETKSEAPYYLSSYRTLLLIGVIIITFILVSQFLHVFTFLIQKVQSGFSSLSSSSASKIENFEDYQKDKYHNTLIVDLDITKNPRLAKAEKIWKQSRRKNLQAPKHYHWNNVASLYPPTFNCPQFTERLGDGKWTCGLELFENHPECVIYSFRKSVADLFFETEMLSRTKYCRIFIYSRERPKSLDLPNSRVQFQNYTLSSSDDEHSRLKILRTLLRQNGHGWIDFLHLDMNNSEQYPVLNQVMQDFEVMPWGQLQLTESAVIENKKEDNHNVPFQKFQDLFAQLEKKGLRPFQAQIVQSLTEDGNGNSSVVTLEYSFINIRGKHLLITN